MNVANILYDSTLLRWTGYWSQVVIVTISIIFWIPYIHIHTLARIPEKQQSNLRIRSESWGNPVFDFCTVRWWLFVQFYNFMVTFDIFFNFSKKLESHYFDFFHDKILYEFVWILLFKFYESYSELFL